MPLYEYRCSQCDHGFEVFQRVGQGARGVDCPECGASKVEKQHSTFASVDSTTRRSTPSTSGGACGPGFT